MWLHAERTCTDASSKRRGSLLRGLLSSRPYISPEPLYKRFALRVQHEYTIQHKG